MRSAIGITTMPLIGWSNAQISRLFCEARCLSIDPSGFPAGSTGAGSVVASASEQHPGTLTGITRKRSSSGIESRVDHDLRRGSAGWPLSEGHLESLEQGDVLGLLESKVVSVRSPADEESRAERDEARAEADE